MIRTFGTALLAAITLAAQIPANLPPFSTFLKANSTIAQVATDPQGYIYVFGETNFHGADSYLRDIFIARLDPSAASVTYSVNIGGLATTKAAARDTPGLQQSLDLVAAVCDQARPLGDQGDFLGQRRWRLQSAF
jgi:hypothetical protein